MHTKSNQWGGKNSIKTYHTFTFTQIAHGSKVLKMCCSVADNPGRCCLMLKKHKLIAPASALQQPQRNLFSSSHSHVSSCQWPPPPPNLQKPGPQHPAINVMRHTDLIVNLGMLTRQKTLSLAIREGLLSHCQQVFF